MKHPLMRPRRLRQADWIRQIVAEASLKTSDLILPLFVCEGQNITEEIDTMPGVNRFSIDNIVKATKKAYDNGIKLVALFPVVNSQLKNSNATESFNESNIICKAIAQIKKEVPGIGVMADVALDPYTNHGHDGILINDKVDNDVTIGILAKQALTLASAGCDIIAPSDMMDGRIRYIREVLESAAFKDTIIMSYVAKYASAFYGPFRNAVKSNLSSGQYLDKRTYQMDIRNSREAMCEIQLDEAEGADILLVKPGLPFLDIIALAAQNTNLPIVGYQVSGEYSMIKYASMHGALDFDKAMFESLIAFKRAGASAIITYAALEVAMKLNEGQ